MFAYDVWRERRNLQLSWTKDMFETVDCFCSDAMFFKFEGSICVAEEREYAANVFYMFLRWFRKHTTMLSWQIKANFQLGNDVITAIVCWKVLGALCCPNSIRVNRSSPR